MRVVIVHTIEQTRAALKAAAALNAPLILQSAPDAMFYAGSQYLTDMFEQALASFPEVDATVVIDGADAGAETIAAMQAGAPLLRSTAPEEIRERLADIGSQHGIELAGEPVESLDLEEVHDAEAACREWLQPYTRH